MIKVTKQQSLFFQSVVILAVGMLSIPVFQSLTVRLDSFVWPFSPWEHWYGWGAYLIVWIYAFIAWAFCWVSQYIMWLTPLVVIMLAVLTIKERRSIIVEGYKKLVLFQTRNLSKSWVQGKGFGKVQLSSFLNATHLALSAQIPKKDLQMWFLLGFRQGNTNADKILEKNKFEIIYSPRNGNLASLPEMLRNGKLCPTH